MQTLNRQFLSLNSSDSILMESLAFSYFDSLTSALPVGMDTTMSLKAALIQSHLQLVTATPSALYNESVRIKYTVSANENILNTIGLTVQNTSDSLCFYEKSDVGRSTGIYFSINVQIADMSTASCAWIIDAERAASFRITIFGMARPVNNGLQIVNSTVRCDLRKMRDHMGIGRRICLVNQHLNL